jgi:hypothetical protein
MGYLQTTGSVSTPGPGATLSFSTPICAQVSLQVSGSGSASVNLEASLDGSNFTQVTVSGGMIKSNPQSFTPIAAIRYNVVSISGTVSISIAAAPYGTQ